MSEFIGDVTVVGSGIAGLWSAKELVDLGLKVNVIEKSGTLADGATTRNEGWLHAGTYHAVAIENEDEISSVVANTIWSHEKIVDFAPESIDHSPTFALAASDEIADKAIERWDHAGVGYKEVSKNEIRDADILDKSRLSAAFSVEDKSINSRILCQKLARYILEHGGRFFMNADFIPTGNTNADVLQGPERHTFKSERFLITAGAGIKDIVEQVTDRELPMRFFKAHLLVLPRLTTDNFFHLEAGEAGLMSHGNVSVAGINRDGIEQSLADQAPVPEKLELIRDALIRMFPSPREYELINSGRGMSVVCNKPDVIGGCGDTQSLDVKVFEPTPNYICALPGKMTMAPYLAKKAVEAMFPIKRLAHFPDVSVTLRPADRLNDVLSCNSEVRRS